MECLLMDTASFLDMPIYMIIYDAYCWHEMKIGIFQIKWQFEEYKETGKISQKVEDYCLAVMTGKAQPLGGLKCMK